MNKTILLIDDDARFRAVMLLSASELNCDVFQCVTLKEAGVSVRSSNFDLLIVDKDMPDGDGLDWLRQIRAEGISTPAIFISACVNDGITFAELLELDVCLILQKPVSMPTLKEEIGILLGIVEELNPDEQAAMAQLEKLKAEFARELPSLIGAIKSFIQKSHLTKLDRGSILEAARHAHILRGTAAIFGFASVGRRMSWLEEELRQLLTSEASEPDASVLENYEEYLDVLLCSNEIRQASTPLFRTLRCQRMPRIICFTGDRLFAARLKQLMSSEGVIVYSFEVSDRLGSLILEIEPALIVLDHAELDRIIECRGLSNGLQIQFAAVLAKELWGSCSAEFEKAGVMLLDKQMSNLELLSRLKSGLKWEPRPIFGSIRGESVSPATALHAGAA